MSAGGVLSDVAGSSVCFGKDGEESLSEGVVVVRAAEAAGAAEFHKENAAAGATPAGEVADQFSQVCDDEFVEYVVEREGWRLGGDGDAVGTRAVAAIMQLSKSVTDRFGEVNGGLLVAILTAHGRTYQPGRGHVRVPASPPEP